MLTPDQAFSIVNTGILPFWLLLAVFPFARATRVLVHAAWLPLLLAAIYAAYIIVAMTGPSNEEAGFSSLAAVMAIFANPTGALVGWVHYLVFDLFIGAWQVRDAQRRGIPHFAVIPCLFLTLMLGPVGLALYLLLRGFWKRAWSLDESLIVSG